MKLFLSQSSEFRFQSYEFYLTKHPKFLSSAVLAPNVIFRKCGAVCLRVTALPFFNASKQSISAYKFDVSVTAKERKPYQIINPGIDIWLNEGQIQSAAADEISSS